MILTHSYWYFQSEVPKETCESIIEMGLQKEANTGAIHGEKDPDKVKQWRNSEVTWMNDKWLYEIMQARMDEANQRAEWNFDWEWCEEMQFTIYKPGQYYHWHSDQNAKTYTNGNFDGMYRKLTTILHLSDPDTFGGGELEFDLGRLTDTKLAPELRPQGSIVVFPSFLYHRVHPVTFGTRYTLVMWALGKPFK